MRSALIRDWESCFCVVQRQRGSSMANFAVSRRPAHEVSIACTSSLATHCQSATPCFAAGMLVPRMVCAMHAAKGFQRRGPCPPCQLAASGNTAPLLGQAPPAERDDCTTTKCKAKLSTWPGQTTANVITIVQTIGKQGSDGQVAAAGRKPMHRPAVAHQPMPAAAPPTKSPVCAGPSCHERRHTHTAAHTRVHQPGAA